MAKSWKDSSVERDLRFWGWQHGRLIFHEGYPTTSAVARIYEGMTNDFESRVLSRDMRPRAWQIHREILQLPKIYQVALMARYCFPERDEDGAVVPANAIAKAIGCTKNAYYIRLSRAKKKLKKIQFPY